MKKTFTALLLGSTVLPALFASSTIFAATEIKGEAAAVPVTGQLGAFDPHTTDPDAVGVPGTDEGWIQVTVPTKVFYYSTAKSGHKNIASSEFSITNLSAYPVAVKVESFKGSDGTSDADITGIANLQINALPTMIGLVDGAGVVDLAQDTLLFKLGPNSNKPEYNQGTGAATKTFNLSGATKDITAQAGHQASNTLNLIFTSLDAAGNPASS